MDTKKLSNHCLNSEYTDNKTLISMQKTFMVRLFGVILKHWGAIRKNSEIQNKSLHIVDKT